MWLEDPTTDDIVRAIAMDLLLIQKFRAFDRNTWPMTMQPLLFRTAGMTALVAERSDGERRRVMVELSTAIIGIMPPDEHGNPDDAAWLRLAAAHARAVNSYAANCARGRDTSQVTVSERALVSDGAGPAVGRLATHLRGPWSRARSTSAGRSSSDAIGGALRRHERVRVRGR